MISKNITKILRALLLLALICDLLILPLLPALVVLEGI